MTSTDHAIEQIARVCHEANRAWCQVNGDYSQLPWFEAPEWQRQAAITGVNFALLNPNAPPGAQHDAWLADKKAHGWSYGPSKDEKLKTHPCILPFEELPHFQQAKDKLLPAIVSALAQP